MALLETGMQPGQQVLKPTDTAALFRQSRTVGTTPVASQVVQPTSTPTQAPVPQQVATRPVASPAVAAPSPGVSSTTRIPKSSAPVPTPAAPGEQYQHQYKYESPQGDGLLDKNYYEDLGFSTSREKAEELRGTFKDIDTEASALSGDIAQYQTETDEARIALQEQVDNAWAEVATSTVTLGPTTWKVPRDAAVALRKSIGLSFDAIGVPPTDGMTEHEYIAFYAKDILDDHPPYALDAHEYQTSLIQNLYEYGPAYYQASLAVDNQDTFDFSFAYDGTQSYNRAIYYALTEQISPQISKMKADYTQAFTDEAQKTFDILDERTLEAQQSTLDLEGQLASVEMDKQAVVDKQAADRAGMAETFNTLFRQRN